MFRADTELRQSYAVASVIGWAVLGVALLLAPFVEVLPTWVVYAPFVVSLVLFGLPHGAVDHLVAGSQIDHGRTLRFQVLFCLGYLGLAVAIIGVWFLAPLLSIAAFLALTIWHWGSGDFHVLMARSAEAARPHPSWGLLAVLLRGGLPILLPFVFWPNQSLAIVQALAGLFGASLEVSGEGAGVWRGWTIACFCIVGSFYGYRKFVSKENFSTKRHHWIDVGELLLLTTFFALLPPVFAVGLYFVFWHSVRHLARLLVWQRGEEVLQGRAPGWPPALRRLALRCVPMTVAALALTALLGLGVSLRPAQAQDWLALYLVFIAAVTVPHALVVAWMDRQDGLPVPGFLPENSLKLINPKDKKPCLN